MLKEACEILAEYFAFSGRHISAPDIATPHFELTPLS
jgi:hypothetical protein